MRRAQLQAVLVFEILHDHDFLLDFLQIYIVLHAVEYFDSLRKKQACLAFHDTATHGLQAKTLGCWGSGTRRFGTLAVFDINSVLDCREGTLPESLANFPPEECARGEAHPAAKARLKLSWRSAQCGARFAVAAPRVRKHHQVGSAPQR